MGPEDRRKVLFWASQPPAPSSSLVRVPPGLCLQLLCPLLKGAIDAKVTQTPGRLVKGKGHKARTDCIPEKGHTFVYWYQQTQKKELKFLIYFQNGQVPDQINLLKEQFSDKCPPNSPCVLEIQSSDPEDSALYFRAGS